MSPINSLVARFAPMLFVVIWATGFIVARLVAPHIEPLTFLLLRYLGAMVALTIIAMVIGATWPRTRNEWFNGLVSGILLHGFYLGGVFWAVRNGMPGGIASLIAGLQPLATAALVGPLLGERVSVRRWVGVIVGMVGAVLVVVPKLGTANGIPTIALIACLIGMVSITFGTIWQKKTGSKVDLVTNTIVQYIAAFIVTLPVAMATETIRFEFGLALITGYLWAVLGLSVGAILLLMMLIRRGAVAGVATLIYLVPPVSAVMAYFAFNETLSAIQIAGMITAATGVAIASRS